ncbi:MAG TPA: IPTL-CTERM sorting domain-containing protein, partial [Xanthomonadales bacterium]|nr:IPTL-CTERM sorting domain-containing protein [Xanthomonadales bacterium]
KELYSGGFLGTSDAEFNADVVPDWDGGTACWVLETVYDSAVEVNNGCGSNPFPGMNVELAGGDSCTVVNTVFFEGIPTLSQYGMAVLALLMLGLGFVGFRRFV